jgi:hypothetical protein
VVGTTQIKLDKARPITVYVVQSMPHEFILGDSDLTAGKAVVNLGANELTWWENKWPLSRSSIWKGETGTILFEEINSESDPITKVVARNSDVFSRADEPPGHSKNVALTIETEGRPIKQRAYRAPLAKRKYIEEEIEKMLRWNYTT